MSCINSNRKCGGCGRFLNKVPGFKKTITTIEDCNLFSVSIGSRLVIGDTICNKCRITRYCKRKINEISDIEEEEEEAIIGRVEENQFSNDAGPSRSNREDPEYISQVPASYSSSNEEYMQLSIQRTVSTHAYCCVCDKKDNLVVVPQEAIIQTYLQRRIHIPSGNRCCATHLIKRRFYVSDLNAIRIISNTSYLTKKELHNLLELVTAESTTPVLKKINNLSENQVQVLTGLSFENIVQLRHLMISIRDNEHRTGLEAIFVFLVKLRTGNSNKLISTIINLEREQMVSDYSASVINGFEKDILPFCFGIENNSRQDLIDNHTTEVAKKLYDAYDKLILICDGTYARHQKSSNNEYQRKSYSGQKKTPLCKPFTVCTTDGYVVDMLGPYQANQNDATIMKQLLQDSNGVCKLMQPGDIFILDRGFRDVVTDLENKGFKVLMPALKGKQKQLTVKQANESRFVTKTRWVVESVHGMLKMKYQLLDNILDNKMLPKIKSYYRIASFLLNEFGKRLESDKTIITEVLDRMASRINEENTLASEIEQNGWLRKKLPFEALVSRDILDFPEMTETELKIFFTGTYQYSQSISYLAEMIKEDGSIDLHFVRDNSSILKVLVASRHISRKSHRCFLEYVPHSNGVFGIPRYYCECANGMRTVGCCSHLAAIIYYLCYARYCSKIIKPAEILTDLFKNSDIPVTIIEDDSDND